MRFSQVTDAIAKHISSGYQVLRPRLQFFCCSPNFHGGWEIWMQSEVAYALQSLSSSTVVRREVPYPSKGKFNTNTAPASHCLDKSFSPTTNKKSQIRADFYSHRPGLGGPKAEVWIELKCLVRREYKDAWKRFSADVAKVDGVWKANDALVCGALLATHGVFTPQSVKELANHFGQKNIWAYEFASNGKYKRHKGFVQTTQPNFWLIAYLNK